MITPDFVPYIIRRGVRLGEGARPEKNGPTRGPASTITISLTK